MHIKILEVVVLLVSVWLILVKSTIIDGAEYYIQNEGDDLCVVAGPIGELIPGKLMAYGTAITEPCQDVPEHQWIMHYKSNKSIEISSGAVHKLHLENPLYVNISGDFVHYFRNIVSTSLVDEKKDNLGYLIKDEDSKDCFFSRGKNQSVGLSGCDSSNISQVWNFNLVEDPKAPGFNFIVQTFGTAYN